MQGFPFFGMLNSSDFFLPIITYNVVQTHHEAAQKIMQSNRRTKENLK